MKIEKNEMIKIANFYNNYAVYIALCQTRQFLQGTNLIKCNHLIRLNVKFIQLNDVAVSPVYTYEDYEIELCKFFKNLGFTFNGYRMEVASYV